MNETKLLQSCFCKLASALAANKDEPLPIAAMETLGTTGIWLSSLTHEELVLMQQQLVNQMAHNLSK